MCQLPRHAPTALQYTFTLLLLLYELSENEVRVVL